MVDLPKKFGGMKKDITVMSRLVITKAERAKREREAREELARVRKNRAKNKQTTV